MKHKIGIVGSGQVAQVLARGFAGHGHSVMIGSRDVKKLNDWKTQSKAAVSTGSFEEAAAATPGVALNLPKAKPQGKK